MTTLNVTKAVRSFSEYIDRVRYKNESFLLVKGKKPVAELRPVLTGRRLEDLVETIESLPSLDESAVDGFASDLKDIRSSTNNEEVRDPWAS